MLKVVLIFILLMAILGASSCGPAHDPEVSSVVVILASQEDYSEAALEYIGSPVGDLPAAVQASMLKIPVVRAEVRVDPFGLAELYLSGERGFSLKSFTDQHLGGTVFLAVNGIVETAVALLVPLEASEWVFWLPGGVEEREATAGRIVDAINLTIQE